MSSYPVTQDLSSVVDVSVFIEPLATAVPAYNQGLITGTSPAIPSVGGTNPRIRQYASTAAMLTDGFTSTDPEYIAAGLYFSQLPAPQYVWIGRQDLTAIQTATVDAGGTGYVVGDQVEVTQSGATNGLLTVLTVASGGVVETLGTTVGNQGTGYSVTTALPTTGGTGTGLTVNITAIGETPLQSLQACRIASAGWYQAMSTTATDTDIEAIAPYMQSASPKSFLQAATSSPNVLSGAPGNLLATLKAANYTRVMTTYSTTQGGTAPNNVYVSAAIMGMTCGLTTGLPKSFFTPMFKNVVGITPEPLTLSQVNTIQGNNGNLVLNYANSFSFFQTGIAPSGQHFGSVVQLDVLATNMIYNVMQAFIGNLSVDMTDTGQQILLQAVLNACATSAAIGYIVPGIWQGPAVLNLKPGQNLSTGYKVQSPSFSTATAAQIAAKQAMPIYVSLIEAGSVQSVTIGIYVQR